MHEHTFEMNGEIVAECCSCGVRRDIQPNHHPYRVLLLGEPLKIDEGIFDLVWQLNAAGFSTFSTCQGGCLDYRGDDSVRGTLDALHAARENRQYKEGFVAMVGDAIRATAIMRNYVDITDVAYPFNKHNVTRIAFKAAELCTVCIEDTERWLKEYHDPKVD